MTQPRMPNSNDRARPDLPADEDLRKRWYRYAAAQAGSTESLLAFLRMRHGQTPEEQRLSFEITARDFLRLQSLRMPRAEQFFLDAERMASACHVGRPFEFIQALLLARNLLQSADARPAAGKFDEQSYEAAYDASGLADEPEDGE